MASLGTWTHMAYTHSRVNKNNKWINKNSVQRVWDIIIPSVVSSTTVREVARKADFLLVYLRPAQSPVGSRNSVLWWAFWTILMPRWPENHRVLADLFARGPEENAAGENLKLKMAHLHSSREPQLRVWQLSEPTVTSVWVSVMAICHGLEALSRREPNSRSVWKWKSVLGKWLGGKSAYHAKMGTWIRIPAPMEKLGTVHLQPQNWGWRHWVR